MQQYEAKKYNNMELTNAIIQNQENNDTKLVNPIIQSQENNDTKPKKCNNIKPINMII